MAKGPSAGFVLTRYFEMGFQEICGGCDKCRMSSAGKVVDVRKSQTGAAIADCRQSKSDLVNSSEQRDGSPDYLYNEEVQRPRAEKVKARLTP